jgi:EmrB/QacA subfamily drug resistance transporter
VATERSAPTGPQVRLSHREVLVVFSGLMAGMLLASLDQTVVATALPTIVGELGGLEHLSWVITAYLLTSTASVPIYGKLSDLYGRKRLFQIAIAVFVFGSLLAGIAQDMTQLIVFRGVQGLGAGGIFSMSMAIVGDILPPRERGRYQGYTGSVFAVSSVAGPLLGGLFTDQLTWRWVFYINLPVGIMALIVTSIVLRMPVRRQEHRIDFLGAALMVAGVTCLLLVASWGGNQYDWFSTTLLTIGGAGVLLIALFILQEWRTEEPLLPLRLFKQRVFAAGSAIMFIIGLGMFGAIAFLPLYLQVVKGVSATSSGLRMVPLMLGLVVSSVAAGRIISETGRYRLFPIAGTLLMGLGLLLLSTMGTGTGLVESSVYMILLGCGIGMVIQVIVLAVQNSVDYKDLGVATAGTNFFRSMGAAFGVAISGSIVSNRLDYYLPRLVPQESLNGLDAKVLTASPERLYQLPAPVLHGVVESFSRAVDTAFLWAAPVSLLAFLLTLLLREEPLRETVHVGADPLVDAAVSLDQAPALEESAAAHSP